MATLFTERELVTLRNGQRVGLAVHSLAVQLRRSPAECDLALWAALGRKFHAPPAVVAGVTHRQFSSSPNRQSLGREPDVKKPNDHAHLAALKGGFPAFETRRP